jgi:hypothetical protein
MKSRNKGRILKRYIVAFLTFTALIMPVFTKAQQLSIDAESGLTWFSKNDVRIPGKGGTTFDMLDLIGTDTDPYLRLSFNLNFGERHHLRALFAPLKKSGTGIINDDITFEETIFQDGEPTEGIYKFNTYRLTYRYSFYKQNGWELGAGAAALIRDAKIELRQNDRSVKSTNVGFVPLLHLFAEYSVNEPLSVKLDAEGLGAPQGRAFDIALQVQYDLSDRFHLFGGYRVLEGGSDGDEVYNFSWINYASAGLRYSL